MDLIGTAYEDINCSSFEKQETYMIKTELVNVLLFSVLLLIGLLAVTGNAIAIAAISLRKRTRGPNIASTTFLFVRSLCVADIICGAFTVPFNLYMFTDTGNHKNEMFCLFAASMDGMACTSSIFHLLMMSGDRYLAICRPLVHRTLPRYVVYIGLGISWIVPFVMTFPVITTKLHLEDKNTHCALEHNHCFGGRLSIVFITISALCYFYIPTILILILNYKIFSAIKKRNLNRSMSNFRAISETTAAKTIGVILVFFFVCWFPLFVVYILMIWIKTIPDPLFISVELLSFFNCMLNPILYYHCNKSVNRAIKDLLHKCCSRNIFKEQKATTSCDRSSTVTKTGIAMISPIPPSH